MLWILPLICGSQFPLTRMNVAPGLDIPGWAV